MVRAFPRALVQQPSLRAASDGTRTLRTGSQRLDTPVHPLAPAQETPPPPNLQVHPSRDLTEYEKTILRQLDSYGWIDKPQGIVHIPIERAIELTAERGLPARGAR